MANSNLPYQIAERFPVPDNPENRYPAKVINQTGEKNTFINNVENLESKTYILQNGEKYEPCLEMAKTSLCHDYYNLVVFGRCTELSFGVGHALMEKDRCLTEGFHRDAINSRLCHLEERDIDQLKSYPALILHENTQFRGKTDPAQQAMYATITDIKVQDNGVMIYYRMTSCINQVSINEIAKDLGLQYESAQTELNRTHWVVKKINLSEVLYDARLIGKYK